MNRVPRRLFLVAVSLAVVAGCGPKEGDKPAAPAKAELTKLNAIDDKVGKGEPVKAGDTVIVKYEGKLADGTIFDATKLHGDEPFSFVAGKPGVIEGWSNGIIGAKKGGVRRLEIPWKQAYGEAGSGEKIPPKSDLYFRLDIVDVVPAGKEDEVVANVTKQGTGKIAQPTSTVKIAYAVKDIKGKKLGNNVATVRLDDPSLLPVIAQSVSGLRQGSQVEIVVPPKFGPGGQGMRYGYPMSESVKYVVDLVEVR